jgi:hypothetical protein
MPEYLPHAGVTLLTWAIVTIQFVGVGVLTMRAVGLSSRDSAHAFLAFWLGFGVTLAYLQMCSLFVPISIATLLPLIGLGLGGWMLNGRAIVRRIHDAGLPRGRVALAAALSLWAAVFAQGPLLYYDAGLYHLGAIRWASSFPVMPGLGNLEPALGVNSTAFLYIAALNAANVPGYHVALGLLIMALLLELLLVASSAIANRGERGIPPSAYVSALLLLPTLVLAGQAGFATTMYDAPVYLFTVVMAARLLDLLDGRVRTPAEALLTVLAIALLGFAAITVKISIAVFSVAALGISLGVIVWTLRPTRSQVVGYLSICTATALLFLGPWLVRNAIMSGYLLYPDPALRVGSDWSMPREAVQAYRDTLFDFARVRGPGYQGASRGFDWLGPWFAASWRDSITPVVIAVAVPVAMFIATRRAALRVGRRWLVLVPIWLSLAGWAITAPDPRYAGSLLWLAAAAPVALWLPSLHRLARLALVVAFCAGIEMPDAQYLFLLVQVPAAVASGRVADQPDPPEVPLAVYTTASGLQVYVPTEGDQMWDAPLPATPYPDPALRLRCPPSLECGFKVG